MKTYRIGFNLMVTGILFNILETQYFGWNMTPQSTGEWICDMISMFLLVLGFVVFSVKVKAR